MKIVGEVTSDEELYLDGDLDGKLNLRNRLTIGPNSKVNANIKATEIVVFGTIKGNVESDSRVSLRTGASIVGDIKTAGIVIEDGAYFKGGIDISRNGESRVNGETRNVEARKAETHHHAESHNRGNHQGEHHNGESKPAPAPTAPTVSTAPKAQGVSAGQRR